MNYKNALTKRIKEVLSEHNLILPQAPYENRINGWWFADSKIVKANNEERMLTLDLDVGRTCDLNCSFCFANTHSKNPQNYVRNNTRRIKKILKEAHQLGVKSIKIVGAGEPLLFGGILEVLQYCQELDITPLIFTGGHPLGDDQRAALVFKEYGVKSAYDLVLRLKKLNCSIIVKFMSLQPELQNSLVGARFNYVKLRDQGLLNLIRAGFNTTTPTRLGVDCLLLESNYREVVSLLSFFNRLNIFCVFNTSMDCGKTEFKCANPEIISRDKALQVAIGLYRYCVTNKIPFDKRISPYFCSPVCSQLNHGLFIGDDDEVKACPGGPVMALYSPGRLKQIWQNNPFRKKYKGVIGHECISRVGRTYHKDFEKLVIKALKI